MEELKELLWLLVLGLPVVFIAACSIDGMIDTYKQAKRHKKENKRLKKELQELRSKQQYIASIYRGIERSI